jgi:hypothetical protein
MTIDRNSLAHKRALVQAAALDELPGMYEEIIGYDPTYDDHDEQPSETMRASLLSYLDECMVEDAQAEPVTVAATPEPLTLNTPNLDACTDEELEQWCDAFNVLACICSLMRMSRRDRRTGDVQIAMKHEARADELHRALPAGVRW